MEVYCYDGSRAVSLLVILLRGLCSGLNWASFIAQNIYKVVLQVRINDWDVESGNISLYVSSYCVYDSFLERLIKAWSTEWKIPAAMS